MAKTPWSLALVLSTNTLNNQFDPSSCNSLLFGTFGLAFGLPTVCAMTMALMGNKDPCHSWELTIYASTPP